jgi:NADH-quinone oxidoreductase subunit A
LPETYFPVLLSLGVAMLIGLGMVGLSYIAGKKHLGRTELTPYESGMPMLDRSHKRISIIFFLIAIDFIVFDLEAVFLYPWALVFRTGGWPLFGAVMVFVALILVGYVYIWKKGGLDLAAAKGKPQPWTERSRS